MKRQTGKIVTVLFACVAAAALFAQNVVDKCSVTFEKNGDAVLNNSMFSVQVSPYVGQDYGISKWFSKPTGFEMVDVLYGQTDYVKGHVFGERWEEAIKEGLPTGAVLPHKFLTVPMSVSVNDDGRANVLVQVGEGNYRWTKTIVFRQDYSVLEIRYEMENLKASPVSAALRFHSAMSPGARGKYQDKNENIFISTENGILALDQSLNADQYNERYKEHKFFLPIWGKEEPKRPWVSGKLATPPLAGNWEAQVSKINGDGMTIQIEKDKLVGFYNCPGITIEPVMRAVFLKKGDKWQARCFLGSFGGAKDAVIEDANPLFVSCKKISSANGRISGKIIPLFKGTLQVADQSGKTVFEAPVSSVQPIDISAGITDGNWTVKALDSKKRYIGSIDGSGKIDLFEPEISVRKTVMPVVKGSVYTREEDAKAINAFLKERDFTVYCAWNDSKEVKRTAKEIADRLGVGVAYTKPSGKLLMIGSVNDPLIRDAGLIKNSLSQAWPGENKGAILYYDNLEFTETPVVIVGGSDESGVVAAEKMFQSSFLKDTKAPSDFAFWATGNDAQIYPYSRPGKAVSDKIYVEMAKGEYESAQAVITAYEDLSDVEVTVAPFVNKATGKPMPKGYAVPTRAKNGPLQVRWVNYYPIDRKDGWAGYPDPLLVRPETIIEAGRSQALWLTFISPEKVDAGIYTSSITCKTKQGTKVIPVEMNIWDFEIPKNEGLQGEAYTTLENLPPAETRELKVYHVQRFIQNMVEHGMRVMHVGVSGMTRFHFSKDGGLKDMGDWFFASEDGKVGLDASYLKWLIDESDKAGKPYELSYMLYLQHILNNQTIEFSRAFPDRFKDMPPRTGHFFAGYYSQEMLTLFKRFLEKQNLMKRVIVKIGDEPRSLDSWYNSVVLAADKAGLPYYTCLNSIDWKDAESKINNLALWQPLYMYYNKDFFEKAKKAGAKVSWYNCGPPPRISIMTPAPEIRGYIWQGAKADLDIIAWWGIMCWGSEGSGTGKDLWQNRYSHWNVATYPEHPYKPSFTMAGKGWVDIAPLDSVRWELIREGMEDAWYVNILRKEIEKARAAGNIKDADRAQSVLDGIWTNVFPTLNDYRPDYAKLLQSRKAIAEEILKLKKTGSEKK